MNGLDPKVGSKTILAADFSATEKAWKIEDATLVLQALKSEHKIVLGGDVLNENLEHSYDNWYYQADACKTPQQNIADSIDLASVYISDYIKANGTAFYVILIW